MLVFILHMQLHDVTDMVTVMLVANVGILTREVAC